MTARTGIEIIGGIALIFAILTSRIYWADFQRAAQDHIDFVEALGSWEIKNHKCTAPEIDNKFWIGGCAQDH